MPITFQMEEAADFQIVCVDDNRKLVGFYCAASRKCGTVDDGGVWDGDALRYYPSEFDGAFYCIACHQDSENWLTYPTLEEVFTHTAERENHDQLLPQND